jgi:DNA-directed RNA polymerase specialized sigma subunit
LRRTTDCGREGDRTKFRPDPALGLLREDVRPASEQARLDALPEVLTYLAGRERAVVHLLYWGDLSARKVGQMLGMDHKTVARVHASALAKLRRLYGLEDNLAA